MDQEQVEWKSKATRDAKKVNERSDLKSAGWMKVSCGIFKHGVMDCSRCSGELADSGDMIADMRATRNIGVHELTKKGAIGEALFGSKVGMFLGVFKGSLFLV